MFGLKMFVIEYYVLYVTTIVPQNEPLVRYSPFNIEYSYRFYCLNFHLYSWKMAKMAKNPKSSKMKNKLQKNAKMRPFFWYCDFSLPFGC